MRKSENNIPKKGMNRQTHPAELTNQEYSFALNANIQDEHGDGDLILVNEPSNIKCSGFKDGFVVVKHKYDRVRNRTYFFLSNPTTGCSEIGWIDMSYVFEGNEPLEKVCNCEVKVVLEDGLENIIQESTCEYNTLISDYCELTNTCTGCLNFSLQHPITDVVIRHSQRGDEIYFTDGNSPQRYIKIDEVQSYFQDVDDCTGEIIETCLDCEKLRVFNLYDFPCMKVEKVQSGGSLKAGTYEVTIAYSDINGNEFSDYLSLTNYVSIFDFNNTVLDQTTLDYQTNQAFSIDIQGLDLDYDYYRVIIISRTGNNPAPVYTTYGVFPTSQNKLLVTSLPTIRQEIVERNENDILNRRPLYLTAEGLAEVNGYLFQHSLTNQRTINLQPVVNLMGGFVKWGTVEAFEKIYKDGTSSALYKGYMRDEVYPLSIQFKMRGGHRTPNFIFVPRPPKSEEIEVIDTEDVNYQSITETLADCADEGRDKVWQYLNTGTVEESTCLISNPDGEVEVKETYSCESKTVITIGAGKFPNSFSESIAEYISENTEEILASTDPLLADIQEALEEEYDDCEPTPLDNCTAPVLISEKVVVSATTGESDSLIEVSEYSDVLAPNTCSNLVDPITANTGVESALPSGSSVNQKTAPVNVSCSTAIEVATLVTGVAGNGYHLDDKYQIGSNSSLLTTINVSEVSDVFKNKLHSNAIFFKVTAPVTETFTIELSQVLCTEVDDNTNNSVRVTVLEGCPTLVEKPAYGKIITDLSTATVPDRTLTLTSADFTTGVAYIAIDSPMRSDYKTELTFAGTSGTTQLTIGGNDYIGTFDTNLTVTTANFYSANIASWISLGMEVSTIGDTIILRMSEELFTSIVIENLTGDLTVNYRSTNEYHTLQPPCGCFTIYKRDTEFVSAKTYDSITFVKQQTYRYTCTYSQPIVTECDPSPHKQGLFSYWESSYKYPCNKELYDSSNLTISTTDVPDSIKSLFEDYYTTGVSGANYVLSSETNFMDKPIRHYKFPDNRVIPFMRTQDASQNAKPDSLVYPIGFVISNEVINAFLDVAVKNNLISAQERTNIVGYEIFRGDRATERSVIAKGLAFNTRAYNDLSKGGADNPTTYYSNYPLNQLGADILNGFDSDDTAIKNAIFTFHSPETHFNKPTLPFEFGFDGYQTGYAENSFAPLIDHPKYVILGKRSRQLATSLSILETTAETLIIASELLVTGASGGLSAPAAIITAIAAGTGIVIATLFKIGRYRYEWLNTLEQLGNRYNHAYTALSIGKYHDFKVNEIDSSLLRRLKISSYLSSGYKEVREEGLGGQSLFINNFQRETSILLKLSDNFPVSYEPWVTGYDTTLVNVVGGATGTIKTARRTTAPYVTLKQYLPTQYNTVNSIQWLHTGYCGDLTEDNVCDIIFGGDIFISRMTLKRKFPFFTETAWKLSSDVPFKYSNYFNINNGIYTNRGFIDFKTKEDTFSAGSVLFPEIPTGYSLWDGVQWRTNINEFFVNDKHKFLTYYYGIPNFLVESEINLNYRYARLERHEDFYPNVGDALNWIQQSEVPITFDNEYNYNWVYSIRPHKWAFGLLPVNYNRAEWDKLDDKSNGVIYSQQDDISSANRSPFLNYKSLDLHNFNKSFGDLIDVKGIESDQVWVRFTDGMLLLGAIDHLKDRVTESQRKLGIGGIFDERAINFNKTELGSAGTQHKVSVSTEFGHYWVDAKRGKVYEMKPNGQGLEEISRSMDKWFKEQLPFKILKVYPNVNIDNAYGGLGISMGWDDRLKRLFVTKLDYIPKVKDLNYSDDLGFYEGEASCPEGYALINGVCTLSETAEKIQIGEVLETVNAGTIAHGIQPPVLYSDFTYQGAGLVDVGSPTGYTFERLSAPFWVGNGIIVNRITSILGKWVNPSIDEEWIGATSVVRIPSNKVYYVLLGADNRFRFTVNGITLVESDTSFMGSQHTISPENFPAQAFRQVHIYPMKLREGCNVVTIEGFNEGVGTDAMFSAAIIDNTAEEIRNATSIGDLNFLYSTADAETLFTGEPEFVCPEGFEAVNEDICAECEKKDEREPTYNLVSLNDERYFEKAHWTIGYSPLTKTWISYYSFFPNYYNSYNEYFQTGINELGSSRHGVWTHHPFISSYQVFYGELHPFIVEFASKTMGTHSYMESVQFYLDVRKYYNMYDFSDIFGKGFNKAYIYNNFQNSGLLELKPQKKDNQRQLIEYPKYKTSSIEVLQSEMEGKWSFNFLYNSIKNEKQGLPIWINDNVQVLKEINPLTIDYRAIRRDRIRGDYFLTRLIQDEDSRNKMFFRITEVTRNYNE